MNAGRLDLGSRRAEESLPPLYDVTVNTAEKRLGVPIFVTRSKPEANAVPLKPGDRVAVGLNAFRVLPNYALASERGSRIVDARK
ncbi:MAG TPA: hypothetical protein VFS10_01700 [Pyrinomonadaceae bacterium]|nr:hypothetical protein [Pyrinomonadaceae bacterium]